MAYSLFLWDLTLIGKRNEYQQGRWAPKGGGLWDPILVGEGNEARSRMGVDCEIPRWLERGMKLGLEGGGWGDLTLDGEGNKAFFIRVWKHLPSRHVLKTLRGSSKRKVQIGQYLLAVDLGYYNFSSKDAWFLLLSNFLGNGWMRLL